MSYYPTPVPEPPNARFLRDELNRIRTAINATGGDTGDLEQRVTDLEAAVAALENRYPLTWDGVS